MLLADIAPVRSRNPETGNLEGEHAFIAGITGFGKSYLVKRLADMREYVIIHDPKCEVYLPGYKRVDSFRKLQALDPRKHPRAIYAPNRKEARDPHYHDLLFRFVYERTNTTLVLDELNFIAMSRHDMPEWMFECYTRGRTRGIEIWALTQEPSWIPSVTRTQTKHRYCFYMADEAHQERMAGLLPGLAPTTKGARERIASLQKRQFFYYRLGERHARGPYVIKTVGKELTVDETAAA